MRAFKVIQGSAEAFQLLADETRRRIIYLLRAKEMTVSQIADELGLTPQAIYHHIRKLRDADMVEVGREERVDHFIETYYRATAEMFYFEHGEAESKELAVKRTREAIAGLSRVGLEVHDDPETITKIVELDRKADSLGAKSEIVQKVTKLDDVDFLTVSSLAHFAKMLSMSERDFDEYLRIQKEIRTLLRTKLVEVDLS